MLLHFFQPPPQPISLALTQHMTKGLHLACRASQRLVGLDQPRPQDAERSCIFDGSTEACSFNTRACPRTRVQTSSLSRGVELRLLSPAARYQSDPSNLSAFFGRRRQHTPQDFTQRLQDILEGPFDTVGSLQRAYTFQQLAASDLMYGQRLIDESEGGHSVDDEYLRASHWRTIIEFLNRNKMRVPSPNPTKRSSQNAIMFACRPV
jgi:hypothetical protein